MKARYKAIVDRFAASIRRGDIASGTRLPTHRDLSAKEHISLATATRVYAELEAMGLVSGETGRGTFVREIALPPGHGVDQHAVASDVLDLNFNYPTLPGRAMRYVMLCDGWPPPVILNHIYAISLMPAGLANARSSPDILPGTAFSHQRRM